MASIRVPSNVSSITFVTSGVKAPTAGIISGLTAPEATAFSDKHGIGKPNSNKGVLQMVSVAANGDITLSLPASIITSITINSIAYGQAGAVTPFGRCLTSAVPAPAASIALFENFGLVTG